MHRQSKKRHKLPIMGTTVYFHVLVFVVGAGLEGYPARSMFTLGCVKLASWQRRKLGVVAVL
jgi:hypothetical protein